MIREFIYTEPFNRCWKAMGLNDEHLQMLEKVLNENPLVGDVIPGLDGARKIRIQLGTKGKSGGGRVIYLVIFEASKTYLLFAYPKNVQENLTPDQTKAIRSIIEAIKRENR